MSNKKRGFLWWDHPGFIHFLLGAIALLAIVVALCCLNPHCFRHRADIITAPQVR